MAIDASNRNGVLLPLRYGNADDRSVSPLTKVLASSLVATTGMVSSLVPLVGEVASSPRPPQGVASAPQIPEAPVTQGPSSTPPPRPFEEAARIDVFARPGSPPALTLPAPRSRAPDTPAEKPKPASTAQVTIPGIGKVSWEKASAFVRSVGGTPLAGGKPTVLALRTANRPSRTFDDWFVVMRPDGKMKAFKATTRPTGVSAQNALLLPGVYSAYPRWRDGEFGNTAFIVARKSGGMTVKVARDVNEDAFYSKREHADPSSSSNIRIHQSRYGASTDSAGCPNVQDYAAFLRFLGGRDSRFSFAVVDVSKRG